MLEGKIMDEARRSLPFLLCVVVAAMLFLAVAPLPYGYYTLLRIVVTGTFAWGAFVAYFEQRPLMPWVFGAGAVLFNPIIPIHLNKELWMLIDSAAAIFLLIAGWMLRPARKTEA